jgi:hypothetical protein
MRRTRRDPAAEDTQTVERVRDALEGYLAAAGPDASVSVKHVLGLLDPRGLWRFDPEHRKPGREPATETVPLGDPLTGARWAGPPGSSPSAAG